MVSFYRDAPEYAGRPYKYYWYYTLFDGVESQDTRIFYSGSNGYGALQDQSEISTEPVPKNEFVSEYYLDGELVLSFNRAELTLSGDTFDDMVFDNLNDPDVVRLSFEDASLMGIFDNVPKDENGVPIMDDVPYYHSVKFQLNELPSDNFSWSVRLIGVNDAVVRTASGTVEIIPAPWEASE